MTIDQLRWQFWRKVIQGRCAMIGMIAPFILFSAINIVTALGSTSQPPPPLPPQHRGQFGKDACDFWQANLFPEN